MRNCFLQLPRGALLAAMEEHKVAEGNPFPLPHKTPVTPIRPTWTFHLASLKMCNLHTSLTVQIDPWPISVLAEDAALLHMRPTPSMECLIYPYPGIPLKTKVGKSWKNWTSYSHWIFSMISQKAPWFEPELPNFSLTGKNNNQVSGFHDVWQPCKNLSRGKHMLIYTQC